MDTDKALVACQHLQNIVEPSPAKISTFRRGGGGLGNTVINEIREELLDISNPEDRLCMSIIAIGVFDEYFEVNVAQLKENNPISFSAKFLHIPF